MGKRQKRAAAVCAALAVCLPLTGCAGGGILERTYVSVSPHSAVYWENENADTLRANNYQELVNALLLLLSEHSEEGTVRIYGELPDAGALSGRACREVQRQTALGAYLLDYITYTGEASHGYYELSVRFGYRRSEEEQRAVINATSTEALPDLLRAAAEEGRDALVVRVGYFTTDRDGVKDMVRAVQAELSAPQEAETGAGEEAPPEEAPEEGAAIANGEEWQVFFYPDTADIGIVEVLLRD